MVELARLATVKVCAEEIFAIVAVAPPDSIPAIVPLNENELPPVVNDRLSPLPGVQIVSAVTASLPMGAKPIVTGLVAVSVVPDAVKVPSSTRLPRLYCESKQRGSRGSVLR